VQGRVRVARGEAANVGTGTLASQSNGAHGAPPSASGIAHEVMGVSETLTFFPWVAPPRQP
jgi:hypothetical protein